MCLGWDVARRRLVRPPGCRHPGKGSPWGRAGSSGAVLGWVWSWVRGQHADWIGKKRPQGLACESHGSSWTGRSQGPGGGLPRPALGRRGWVPGRGSALGPLVELLQCRRSLSQGHMLPRVVGLLRAPSSEEQASRPCPLRPAQPWSCPGPAEPSPTEIPTMVPPDLTPPPLDRLPGNPLCTQGSRRDLREGARGGGWTVHRDHRSLPPVPHRALAQFPQQHNPPPKIYVHAEPQT